MHGSHSKDKDLAKKLITAEFQRSFMHKTRYNTAVKQAYNIKKREGRRKAPYTAETLVEMEILSAEETLRSHTFFNLVHKDNNNSSYLLNFK